MGFGSALLLAAFWLFFLQPLAGKAIVPWFGGGADVWVTCMVFFQAMLLAGYGYAHLLATRLRPARQYQLHMVVLAAALALGLWTASAAGAPYLPPPGLRPTGMENPVLRLLAILAATLALPFAALSATSPLVQTWYARTHPERPAYRLYALSNVGSFLGLLLYPFGAEILLTRRAQAWLAFAVMAATAACLAWIGRRAARIAPLPAVEDGAEAAGPSAGRRAAYLALAALGSVLLVSGTSFLSSHVATIPLLWVLPLAAYLLSFIVCFEWGLALDGRWGAALLAALLLAQGATPLVWNRGHHVAGVLLVTLVVLLGGILCHGVLYALRPAHRHLTRFYLMLSAGGVLGGLLAGPLAPFLFKKVTEFHLGLLLASALGWWLGGRAAGPWKGTIRGLSLACAAVIGFQFASIALDPRISYRDFFGPLKVEWIAPQVKKLTHAGTNHGIEAMDRPSLPLAYFGQDSGLSRAFAALRARRRPLRIGIIGLGVGNAVGYAQEGDEVVVYEISPLVIRLSGRQDPLEFTILRDSLARVEVVPGDARLSLDRELATRGPRGFDLLMVDAFSGGNVPWHLLTLEALQGFRRHLATHGIIAFHASNDHRVDLLVLAAARGAGLWAAPVRSSHRVLLQGSGAEILSPNTYVLLAAEQATLEPPAILDGAALLLPPRAAATGAKAQADPSPDYRLKDLRALRPWTDERNCLSELLWLGR